MLAPSPMPSVRHIAAAALMIASACSEGDNDMGPTPGNSAPAFTSASSVDAAEGTGGTFYTATATDADGDAVTFTLAGGADQALFSITTAGGLSFDAPPDFERPRDADLDNAYQIVIRAGDGTATTDFSLAVNVTDRPEAYRLRRIASGLAAPLFLIGRPGADDVFVAERAGRVRLLDPDTGAVDPTPFLDISAEVGTTGEGGLLGLAPAPDYETSGAFYAHITNTSGDTEIRRYERSAADPDVADAGTEDLILTVAQPATNHNGGWIGFGADGFLYIALGDGGGANDAFGNGQNVNTILGAMLRIDPSGDAFPGDPDRDYAIPAGNPFAGGGGAPEIWAYGLRNPFRAGFDRDTGDLYIGDVGQGAVEEVDLIPAGASGLNFGWPVREGTQMNTGPDSPEFTPPVAEYFHGTGPREGNTVTGGYVYRGPVAALDGRYFFADFISDNVWSLPVDEISQGDTISSDEFILENGPLSPDAGSLASIASFGEDNAGNLYLLNLVSGDIFRIEAAP